MHLCLNSVVYPNCIILVNSFIIARQELSPPADVFSICHIHHPHAQRQQQETRSPPSQTHICLLMHDGSTPIQMVSKSNTLPLLIPLISFASYGAIAMYIWTHSRSQEQCITHTHTNTGTQTNHKGSLVKISSSIDGITVLNWLPLSHWELTWVQKTIMLQSFNLLLDMIAQKI